MQQQHSQLKNRSAGSVSGPGTIPDSNAPGLAIARHALALPQPQSLSASDLICTSIPVKLRIRSAPGLTSTPSERCAIVPKSFKTAAAFIGRNPDRRRGPEAAATGADPRKFGEPPRAMDCPGHMASVIVRIRDRPATQSGDFACAPRGKTSEVAEGQSVLSNRK
jgi:hypothetical protein